MSRPSIETMQNRGRSYSQSQDHRNEIKFVVPEPELPTVLAHVRSHAAGFRCAFPPRRVNSIYFDTYGWTTYHDHLAGVAERCKLRLRWYGEDLQTVDGGVLELKQRRGTVGRKTTWPVRVPIDLAALTWGEIRRIIRGLDLGPLEFAVQHYTYPTMIVSYERQYFVSRDAMVRLTIDTALSVLPQVFGPSPELHRRALTPRIVVIELKALDSVWQRVSEIMVPLPFRAVASSKYMLGAYAVS